MGKVVSARKERGSIAGKNGDTTPGSDNVFIPSPPLNITDEDLEFIIGTLKQVFQESAEGDRPIRPPVA